MRPWASETRTMARDFQRTIPVPPAPLGVGSGSEDWIRKKTITEPLLCSTVAQLRGRPELVLGVNLGVDPLYPPELATPGFDPPCRPLEWAANSSQFPAPRLALTP